MRAAPPATRAALYARVSTRDQSCSMQLSELRDYAAARQWRVAGEYVDDGVSGATASRPALDRMMAAARQRKIDVIAVWKLDRFGRSLRHIVDALAELKEIGVTFISLRDNLDLTTSAGRALAHMIGVFAEFERDVIGERVRTGQARAKAQGIHCGRPRRELSARRLAHMRKLRAQGLSITAIARRMRGITRSMVYDRLR